MKPAIPRSDAAAAIRSALSRNPVVALLGPRPCGKSTLARQLAAEVGRTLFLDLENPADLAVLAEPMQALANFRGLVVLDEVQCRPDLFPVLRGLADRKPRPARFPIRDTYFWSTHAGAELDLLMMSGGKRIGFEFKFSDAPSTTKSMRIALADLKLDHLWVVHPGQHRHPLGDRIEAIGLAELATSVTRIA